VTVDETKVTMSNPDPGGPNQSAQPNILLITDDQHRWDFFGDTGVVSSLRTPALDRLRAEGTTFTNNYSVCPVCMPARFTWCYGLYPSQGAYRLLNNAHDWPDPSLLPSMPGALQKAGYHTALVGKLHSHAGIFSKDISVYEWQTHARGFDDVLEVCGKSLSYWFDCRWTRYLAEQGLLESYRRDLARRNSQLGGSERYEASPLPVEHAMDSFVGREACRWLGTYKGNKPFFLHASLCGPHFPLDPPEELFARYRPEDMPPPVGVDKLAEVRRWQELRALYCGLIELVDRQVGSLLEVLEERTLLDSTVVVFCSDHGDMIGDVGLNHKGLWHDPSCRTPMTVRYPATVAAGKQVEAMCESVDLPVALMDIAACDPETNYLPQSPGRSFWPAVTGAVQGHRETAYAECRNGKDEWRMIVDREWKYVRHATRGEMLYRRDADPLDRENLAGAASGSAVLPAMRLSLIDALRRCVAPNTTPYFATGRL
jgi:choline-sulfatase